MKFPVQPRPETSHNAGLSTPQPAVAPAALVNRTHRIVRERALALQTRKRTMRSLLIPLGVSATLLAAIAIALWNAFEDYEASPAGLPESSQMLVVLMWSVPLTAMLLAVIWFRRSHLENEGRR